MRIPWENGQILILKNSHVPPFEIFVVLSSFKTHVFQIR